MFLPIFSIAFGLFFAVCGVRIVFFRHFHLLSDYTPGRGEKYARRAGLVQLIGGLVCVATGAVGCVLQNDMYSYLSLFFSVGALLLAQYLVSRQ